tara:strand:+ start:480 stop:827 length:348 start_codon:yes stop_codon:yes gene_type:complete
MALSKVTVVDKIEVLEKGQVQVRTATRVMEDGVELSSSFHRHVVEPQVRSGYVKAEAAYTDSDGNAVAEIVGNAGTWADTDISGEDARVQAIATATWTSAVKTAYQEMIDAQATP